MNTAPKLTVMSDTRFIPAAATPAIEVLSAEKIYSNGTRALLPVNLTINQGEFITLLGPSGCGKSTLLKMVAGLVEPSDGKLMLWRRDSREKAQHPLSFVFQEATLMPWSSVRNNVRLPLDLAGVPRAEGNTRVNEVLELVGLGKFADVLPRELSGGMQMRVSIARGLVTRPKLLLMDEPFGALDEITRNKLDSDLLRLWQEQNLTVVFVTHSIHEAVFLSQRVIMMAAHPGRVVEDIPIREPFPRSGRSASARPFPCMPVSCRTVCCRPASLVWSHNMKTTTATPWIQHPRFLKILYPTLVAVAMVLLWQGAVSYFRIPAFLVPSPLVMLESLWTHLTPLLLALLFTLKITLISFLLSIVIGAAVAFILVQNRFVETALFPYIVFLQVTPIVAIAPLIIIWVKDATLSLVVCATLMAVFPIISNTTQGLRSVSPGLLSYFRLNHASRWQTLVRLRIPSALPYFFGALRISSGLSLIGAVVAEFVAGTGGTNTGLAYQILQAGYQLDIPLMFAALLLISLAGIALFGVMSWVSRRALSAWHESEAVQSH